MPFRIDRKTLGSNIISQVDKPDSIRSPASRNAQVQTPSPSAPVSIFLSLPHLRTFPGYPALTPTDSYSSASQDAQAQVPSSLVITLPYVIPQPMHTILNFPGTGPLYLVKKPVVLLLHRSRTLLCE
jgi:hypothetical protein